MTWDSLKAVQRDTMLSFTRELAEKHHFCQLLSGKWVRTLGAPGLIPGIQTGVRIVHVRGRQWRQEKAD